MKINLLKRLVRSQAAILIAVFLLPTASLKSEILFVEDFEDDTWTGFSAYPSANISVLNSGDTIYGAPPTGADGTYIVAPGGSKLGKMWPLYWSPGNVTTSNSYIYNDWYDIENGWIPYIQGKELKFSMDVYVSSYDPIAATTDVLMYAKFFNQDYSYYYDWASILLSLKDTPLDTWTYREFTVIVPNDVSVAQFGLEITQQNYSPGSINVDNMTLQIVPEPSVVSTLLLGSGLLLGLRALKKK
jgi:hypothetical protein